MRSNSIIMVAAAVVVVLVVVVIRHRGGGRRGRLTSSVDADLDVVPATKEDVVDVDDDGATVAAVIATPDTTGGDDAREAIVLALLSLTRHALSINSIITTNEYIVF